MKRHNILNPYINNDNNCLYCAVGNVLSWYGIEIDHIDAIFNSQIDFFYSKKNDNSMVNFRFSEEFPVNFILDKYSLKERIGGIMTPYGIGIDWKESESYNESWEEICKQNEVSPLVLFVDHYYLEYHEAFKKDHGAHFITLLGYEGLNAYILDSVKLFNYEGVIKYETLKDARVFDTEISKINNAWLSLHIDNNTKTKNDIQCVRGVFKRIIQNMLFRQPDQDKFWGLKAMNVFLEDMTNLAKVYDSYSELLQSDPRLKKSLDNLFISLLRVAQQRNAFSRYLDKLVDDNILPDSQTLKFVSQNCKMLHEKWIRVRNQFYLANVRMEIRKITDILPNLQDIINMEKDTMEMIGCYADKLTSF